MPISIHKILNVTHDINYEDGSRVATFVLDDGSEKRLATLGKLPNDDAQARAAIDLRGQELFDKGTLWDDGNTNIVSNKKDILDNLPNLNTALTAIDNNFDSLTAADRVILKKLVRVIYALTGR